MKFIGVFDDVAQIELSDVVEKKKRKESRKLLKDKYWMTAFVPESGKKFKSTFLYDNGFKEILLQNL